jgi:phosphoglycolate phosphatase-like HAD superfamily hydrolase
MVPGYRGIAHHDHLAGRTETRAPFARLAQLALPPPVTLDKALRSRFNCDPDDIEYWDEMIRLTAERESLTVARIQVRTKWETEQWADAWAVPVSEHLAVNRADGFYVGRNHTQTQHYAGISEALAALPGKKSTATTKGTPTTRAVLEMFGLLPYFDHVQGTTAFRPSPSPM